MYDRCSDNGFHSGSPGRVPGKKRCVSYPAGVCHSAGAQESFPAPAAALLLQAAGVVTALLLQAVRPALAALPVLVPFFSPAPELSAAAVPAAPVSLFLLSVLS